MPEEQIRKRGRRRTNDEAEVPITFRSSDSQAESVGAGILGLHPSRAALITSRPPPLHTADESRGANEDATLIWQRGPRTDSESPFGVLDPDLKAYFRNVENQIRDWEGAPSIGEEREGTASLDHTTMPDLFDRSPNVSRFRVERAPRLGAASRD